MKRTLAISFFFGALLLMGAKDLRAQNWNQITSFPNITFFDTPYFLNRDIGFVFESDGVSQPNLQRTTDGGISWVALRFFDARNIFLSQLYFTDSSHGYAAASNGVYETLDMGNTWTQIYRSAILTTSVYAFGNKVFAISGLRSSPSTKWGPLVETGDDGKTWDTVIAQTSFVPVGFQDLMFPCVIGNKDSIVYSTSVDSLGDIYLFFSINNGKDWASNKFDNINSNITLGSFAFPHCRDILRTSLPENDPSNQDNYFIMHSSDFGAHWNQLYIPFEIGAWIAGNNCVLYVSDAKGKQDGNTRDGVWRSQDQGKSWTYINGPNFEEIDDEDFRNLSVVGGGAVVYAGDVKLNLWKTQDGGDGTLSPTTMTSGIDLKHDFIPAATICDTSLLRISFTNLSCNYAVLKGIKIDGLDSTEFSTQWKHYLICDGMPDTVLIKLFSLPPGPGTFKVHLHFENDEFFAIDSSFDVVVSLTNIPAEVLITNALTPAITICDTSHVILSYQNLSCNHNILKSFSIDGLNSSQFTDSLVQHTILAGVPDSLLVNIFSLPSGTGTYTIHLHFMNDRSQKLDTSFTFTLSPQSIPVEKFYLHPSSVVGKLGDTLDVPLYSNGSQSVSGMTTIVLNYMLNTDLLMPLVFIPINGLTADPIITTRTGATVTLHCQPSFVFTGETDLGYLRFAPYVSDTLGTDVIVTGATHSSGCLTTLADSNILHYTLTGCGTSTLSHFIKSDSVFEIINITPNPAGNSIHLQLKNNGSLLYYQLFDALGALQRDGTTSGNVMQIDLSGLSSGNYYLRINGQNGIPRTRQIVIEK